MMTITSSTNFSDQFRFQFQEIEVNQLEEGAAALMYACQQENMEQLRSILRKQLRSIKEKDRTLKTVLHYCAENISSTCAEIVLNNAPDLLDSADEDGYTTLHLAVIAGNVQMVKFLISKQADLNKLDSEGHSVIHWATVCGEIELLQILLNCGADPLIPDLHGAYPIHYAAQMCGTASEVGNGFRLGLLILQVLLNYSIDVNVIDNDGRQPLLWAASAGSSEAILALTNADASVSSRDNDGLTALHCAASRGHTNCLETLIDLCGTNVEGCDNNGCSPLFYAVTLGHADATQLLLSRGANPNRQDFKGRTPAHCGAAKGQTETLKILKKHKGNLWIRNAKGDYCLHDAMNAGRKDLVRWLLLQRPDYINSSNSEERHSKHIEALNDNKEMCKVGIHIQTHMLSQNNNEEETSIKVTPCLEKLKSADNKTVNGKPKNSQEDLDDLKYTDISIKSRKEMTMLKEVTNSVTATDSDSNDFHSPADRSKKKIIKRRRRKKKKKSANIEKCLNLNYQNKGMKSLEETHTVTVLLTKEDVVVVQTENNTKNADSSRPNEFQDTQFIRQLDRPNEPLITKKNTMDKEAEEEKLCELVSQQQRTCNSECNDYNNESTTTGINNDVVNLLHLQGNITENTCPISCIGKTEKNNKDIVEGDDDNEEESITGIQLGSDVRLIIIDKDKNGISNHSKNVVGLNNEQIFSENVEEKYTNYTVISDQINDNCERLESMLFVSANEEKQKNDAFANAECNYKENILLKDNKDVDFKEDKSTLENCFEIIEGTYNECINRKEKNNDNDKNDILIPLKPIDHTSLNKDENKVYNGTMMSEHGKSDKGLVYVILDDAQDNHETIKERKKSSIQSYHRTKMQNSVNYKIKSLNCSEKRRQKSKNNKLGTSYKFSKNKTDENCLTRKRIISTHTEQLQLLRRENSNCVPLIKSSDQLERKMKELKETKREKMLLQSLSGHPLLCTFGTHRCIHAIHAYTGMPCSAYISKYHHPFPKSIPSLCFFPKIQATAKRVRHNDVEEIEKCLINVDPSKAVTLQLMHGMEKQTISLPTEKLDKNRRYYVTFIIKGRIKENSFLHADKDVDMIVK